MDILSYFKKAVEQKASDLHLVAGSVPTLRLHGELIKLNHDVIDNEELKKAIKKVIGDESWEKFLKEKEMDFAQEFFNGRFRINLHLQTDRIGLAARFISQAIPRPDEIRFDETIYNLTHLTEGLVIVTGPSGCGKSTTLATMIDIINRERRAHIITIEDPIEYLFKENQSIVEQREVGIDTNSFAAALKYALRQDPNVIMVGEMRDIETISAVLTAAETGHLVLSTLHTPNAVETISRIVDVFPENRKEQVLNQLSSILRCVIAQQLLPKKGGGRIVAREIMINNNAIANLIRRGQFSQIYNVIQTNRKTGMITMNKAIDELLRDDLITESTAKNRKRDLSTQAVYY